MRAYVKGQVIADRYRIVGPLGRGGMGHVYRAQHLALGKDIALKVLGAKGIDHAAARFEREAQAIARLEHPSCVRVFDYGRSDLAQFLAMELVEGPTLATVLMTEGRLSTARAVHIARAVLGGLAHAHARGVLHRDVKPDNVIVSTGEVPRVVLIDFGLASLRDADGLTAKGMCVGSPTYVSPERMQGRPYDERCDVYAVGVMLYEMLAGLPPFLGNTPEAIMKLVLDRPPRPLRAIREDISLPLDAIVRRALAKDPARRYADADDMRSALDELVELERAREQPPEPARNLDDDESAGSTVFALAAIEPSWLSRLWSWIRYGRWRWSRPSGQH